MPSKSNNIKPSDLRNFGDEYYYLASPYSPYPGLDLPPVARVQLMNANYVQVCAYAAWLHKQGIWVFSPIVHWHNIAVEYGLPKDAKSWGSYNAAMLSRAIGVIVACMPNWDRSLGIQEEIEIGKQLPQKICYCIKQAEEPFFKLSRQPLYG